MSRYYIEKFSDRPFNSYGFFKCSTQLFDWSAVCPRLIFSDVRSATWRLQFDYRLPREQYLCPPIFRLRSATPQERQVTRQKPVLCGVFPNCLYYCRKQWVVMDKISTYILKANFKKL
jgi:hypothetical protein